MARFSRAEMYHNLSTMLDAGLPVSRTFRVAADGARGKPRKVLRAVEQAAADGSSLADAMQEHPRFFQPIDITLVDAGERSGNLEEILRSMSQWYEMRRRIGRQIKSGLILPALLIHAASVLGPFPKFILMNDYNWQNYINEALSILGIFYIPLFVILGIIHFTPKTGFLRHALDAVALKIPLLGPALNNLAHFRFCQSFNMMLRAGVSAPECAENALNSTGCGPVRSRFKNMPASVREGQPFYAGFSRGVPLDFRESWIIGEETGELDNVTARLANQKADKAEFYFKQLSAWLPRLIYVLISLYLIKIIGENAAAVFGGAGLAM